ncbi:hypothetical protein CBR_g31031 [Chara braunii]|uniref:Uncharacterized protein n=1 Tax=Chara braunii TaxID=69332 RepID=A0A388LE41_CHABU|nr:hypothetical protein CBR_g31031 [Chara braunii]|eukprot:GBG80571.1 hypothetical protein CBR_g31031 [Chara braunii]
MVHMWSCASLAERNWAVHEGIHTKKRNQLAFEKVVQLVEITANVRLTEYRRAGCGYVLPWQRDEGMLDCQAGLELESVRTKTRRGMTDEEIARQVALITRDPIGASAPPSADAVFDRRACIFRPYPRDDDSDEEPIPEAADDPALRIPWEIDETHEDPGSEDTRTQTARRAADRAESEMVGGDEDFWGPFGEVASTGGPEAQATTPTPTRWDSSMPPPPAPSPAPRSSVSPLQPDREELGSSLPQRGLLHRGGAVRQLRLRSPSSGIGQEEGGPSAAAVESSMAPAAVSDATIAAAVQEIAAAAAAAASVLEEMAASVLAEDPPAAGGGAAVEGQVATAGRAGGGAAVVEVEVTAALEEEDAPSAAAVEEKIAAQAEVQRGGDDERLMQQFLTEELGPAIAGMTPGVERGFGISDSEMGTHLDLDLSVGLPPSCGGATSTDRALSRDEAPGRTSTQIARERTKTQSPDAAHDIMERERARLLASADLRAQAFARAVEDARRLEIGGDCVQGGMVAGEDVAEGVAAEPVPETMPGGAETADVAVEGRAQAVDEASGGHEVGKRIYIKKTNTDYVMAEKDGQRVDGEDVILSPRKRGVKKFLMKSSLDEIDTVEPLRRALRQPMQCSILEYLAASKPARDELQMITRKTRIPLSEEGQGAPKAEASTVAVTGVTAKADRMATVLLDGMEGVPPDKFYILGCGAVETIINDGAILDAVIDNGSEAVIIDDDLAVQVGLGLDRSYLFEIETADGRKQQITGVCHEAAIEVQGTVAEACARVVVLRKGGGPIIIKEDDPDTDAAVRDADEDYEGEEEGEEDSSSGSDGDDDDDYDEPPPSPGPPPTHASVILSLAAQADAPGPVPVSGVGGRSQFDEAGTRAFVEGHMWGKDAGTSAGRAPLFAENRDRVARVSRAAASPAVAGPTATGHPPAAYPWLPPPPSQTRAPASDFPSAPVGDAAAAVPEGMGTVPPDGPVQVSDSSSTLAQVNAPTSQYGVFGKLDPLQNLRNIAAPSPPPAASHAAGGGLWDSFGVGVDITVFITDSASSNVSTMEVFQKDESVKHIFWIPCVVHVMDLILEYIGNIEWVATRIAQARVVTKFFKRHRHACEVLEAFTTVTLLLPAETHFGTHVIMMRRLLRLQVHLMRVVIDDRWKNTVVSTKKIRDDAVEVTACVSFPVWWEDMKAVCELLDPIMDMLQMVDSDTRQIGKILHRYDAMILRCLSACAAFDKEEQDAVLEVFDIRRTMFKSPTHVAAMMLDPEFRDRTLADDEEMQPGLIAAVVQFGYPQSSDQHKEVLTAIDKFHVRELPFDDVAMNRAARSYDHSATFWESKEKRFPHTAFFASRILCMPASDDDNDLGDPHPDGDDDDGAEDDDHDDGGDRPRTHAARADGDRGPDEAADGDDRDEGDAGGDDHGDGDGRGGEGALGSTREATCRGITAMDVDHGARNDDDGDGSAAESPELFQGGALQRLRRAPREQDTIGSRIPVLEDSFSDNAREERIEQDDGSGCARYHTDGMHATAPTGSSTVIPEPPQCNGPLMPHPEIEGHDGDDAVMQDEGSAVALHPLTSDGGPEAAAITLDTRRPPAATEQESMLPPRNIHAVQSDVTTLGVAMQHSKTQGAVADDTASRPPPALLEESQETVVAHSGVDILAGEVSHTPAPE